MTAARALPPAAEAPPVGPARLAVSVQFANMGSWAARIPSVRDRLTLDDAQWGLATLGCTVGSLLATVLMVVLAPRLGPRRLASASAALLLINAPLRAAARNPVPLVLGQGLAASSLSTHHGRAGGRGPATGGPAHHLDLPRLVQPGPIDRWGDQYGGRAGRGGTVLAAGRDRRHPGGATGRHRGR